MTMYTNSGNINERTNTSLSLNNEYTYKNASDTQTTKLVETVTSTVYFESESSKEILRRVSLKYDYDDAGRITMISAENDSDGSKNYYPVHLYKYDEAGQITVEWNAFTEMAYAYAYDAGGNITTKKFMKIPNSMRIITSLIWEKLPIQSHMNMILFGKTNLYHMPAKPLITMHLEIR